MGECIDCKIERATNQAEKYSENRFDPKSHLKRQVDEEWGRAPLEPQTISVFNGRIIISFRRICDRFCQILYKILFCTKHTAAA